MLAAASSVDAQWMRRALRLASRSLGMTWPNPGVGCVLVKQGELIGAGRHERCGEWHAETAALRDARQRGHDASGATAYVTLAPCTGHGRQPPCCAALIAAGVTRVVAAIADPGQADAAPFLAQAGIAYDVGLCPDSRAIAAHIHGGFLTRLALGRPRLTAKWAMAIDGAIARQRDAPLSLTDGALRELTRRRRRAFDAILIGSGTVLADDPRLDTPCPRRHGDELGPWAIILAGRRALPATARIWSRPCLIVHDEHADLGSVPRSAARLGVPDVRDVHAVAAALGRWGFNDVLIEGGSAIHGSFLAAGLIDRIEQCIGTRTIGAGVAVADCPSTPRTWQVEHISATGGGALIRWRAQG